MKAGQIGHTEDIYLNLQADGKQCVGRILSYWQLLAAIRRRFGEEQREAKQKLSRGIIMGSFDSGPRYGIRYGIRYGPRYGNDTHYGIRLRHVRETGRTGEERIERGRK